MQTELKAKWDQYRAGAETPPSPTDAFVFAAGFAAGRAGSDAVPAAKMLMRDVAGAVEWLNEAADAIAERSRHLSPVVMSRKELDATVDRFRKLAADMRAVAEGWAAPVPPAGEKPNPVATVGAFAFIEKMLSEPMGVRERREVLRTVVAIREQLQAAVDKAKAAEQAHDSTAEELPELPEPCPRVLPSGWIRYTADQMREYARAALAARKPTTEKSSAVAARKPVEVDEEAERRAFERELGDVLILERFGHGGNYCVPETIMAWRAWKARAALATAAGGGGGENAEISQEIAQGRAATVVGNSAGGDEKPVGQIRDDVEHCRAIWFDGGRLKHGDMLYTRPDPARLAEAAKVVADNLPFIANSVASYMPGHACQGFAVEISQQVDLLRKALREYEAGKLT